MLRVKYVKCSLGVLNVVREYLLTQQLERIIVLEEAGKGHQMGG